jgi:lipopolysaccharide heptosyltransferase I
MIAGPALPGPSALDGQRILLVRTSALGDVVHALPVLAALRRALPRARIGWVVEQGMAPLLAGHPDLDDLVVVRLRAWRRAPLRPATWGEVGGLLSVLDRFAPDVALDLMGNHKAGILAALSFADRRVGASRRHRREPSSTIWLTERVAPAGLHAVDRALSLLGALGLPAAPADFGGERLFPVVPPAARALLEAREGDFALLHPGAGWANKRYPPAAWGEAARRLAAAGGPPTWVATAPGEEGLAAAIAAVGGGAARPVPAPDLPTLAALARRAALVLGGDSGPLHLAHALGAPVLMVMGPTDPERTGPYGAPERALVRRLPCSFCYRRFDDVKACLLEIPPAAVAARALELLAARPPVLPSR